MLIDISSADKPWDENDNHSPNNSSTINGFLVLPEPSKKGRDLYYCPVCNGDKLWISPEPKPGYDKPAVSCKKGCEAKDIYQALYPKERNKPTFTPLDRTVHKADPKPYKIDFSKLSPLSDEHRQKIKDRGFTDVHVDWMIDQKIVFSVNHDQILDLGCFKFSNPERLSAIALVWGDSFIELRLDQQIKLGDEFSRYLSPTAESGIVRSAWIPDGAVAATEGMFDALAGTLIGCIPTAAIPGIGQFRLLPENSGLCLIADSDAVTNQHVKKSLQNGSDWLGGGFAFIPEIAGEPKAGLGEFFQSGFSQQDYQALIDSSAQHEANEVEAVEPWILSARAGMGLPLDRRENKKSGETTYLLPSQLVACEYILEKFKGKLCRAEHDIYLLNPKTGIFDRCEIGKTSATDTASLTKLISKELGSASPVSGVSLATANWIKGVRELIVAMAPRIVFSEKSNLLPLKNGVYDSRSKSLKSYEALRQVGEYFNYQSPVAFDKSKDCPSFKQWLSESMSQQDQKKLQAGAYATIFSLARLKILMELIGESDSGKSVFQRVLEAIVGSSKTKSIELRKLQESNFSLSGVHGKKLVIVPDSKGFIGSPDTLKRLSGLDSIDVERKGQDAFDTTFRGIIWVAGNAPIITSDDDNAFTKRRIVCRSPHSVPVEKQRQLLEFEAGVPVGGFAEELSGILNWIVNLGEDGTEQIIRAVKSDKTQYVETLLESNTIAQWLNQNCVIRHDAVGEIGVKSGDPDKHLYANYLRYCEDHGHRHPMAIQKFKAQVLEVVNRCQDLVKVTATNPHSHGKRSVLNGLEIVRVDSDGTACQDQAALSYAPLSGMPADSNPDRADQVETVKELVVKLKSAPNDEVRNELLETAYDSGTLRKEGDRLLGYLLPQSLKHWFSGVVTGESNIALLRSATLESI